MSGIWLRNEFGLVMHDIYFFIIDIAMCTSIVIVNPYGPGTRVVTQVILGFIAKFNHYTMKVHHLQVF